MLHEVGVVVDAATRRVLLQQKPVIMLPLTPPPTIWLSNGGTSKGFTQLLVSDGSYVQSVQLGLDYANGEGGLLFDGTYVWGVRRLKGTDSIVKFHPVTGARLGGMSKGSSYRNAALNMAFDGTNYWYNERANTSDVFDPRIYCIDVNLNPIRNITLGGAAVADTMIYDGVGNIWVGSSNTLYKVRASDGAGLGTVALDIDLSINSLSIATDKVAIWTIKNDWNGGNQRYYIRRTLISDRSLTSYGPFTGQVPNRNIAWDGTYFYMVRSNPAGTVKYVEKLRVSDVTVVASYALSNNTGYGVHFDGTNLWVQSAGIFGKIVKMTTSGAIIGEYPNVSDVISLTSMWAFTNIVLPWP